MDQAQVESLEQKHAALEALIRRVRSRVTVVRSVTMIALSAIKEDGALDVGVPAGAEEPADPAANGQRPGRPARR